LRVVSLSTGRNSIDLIVPGELPGDEHRATRHQPFAFGRYAVARSADERVRGCPACRPRREHAERARMTTPTLSCSHVMTDDRFMHEPAQKVVDVTVVASRHLLRRAEERDAMVVAAARPCSPCERRSEMSCDTTTLVTLSSCCSFRMSFVIVAVVSGSSPTSARRRA
jgi:hypothetical protein